MWTYNGLKTAIEALDPAPIDDTAAAAAINSQTTTLPDQDVSTQVVLSLLLSTGEFGFLQSMTLSGATTDTTLQAICFNLLMTLTATDINVFGTSDSTIKASIINSLSYLESVSKLSTNTKNLLLAMINPVVPTWEPSVTAEDIATAKLS